MNFYAKLAMVFALSYLLGSVNFAIIVSKFKLKDDIRKFGSGNAGGTNALRTMGLGSAMLVFAGDGLKAAVAMVVTKILFPAAEYTSIVSGGAILLFSGIFVILGHIYPVFFGFKGGKGVMTIAVIICVFNYIIGIIGVFVFVLCVIISRFVSLSSILAVISVSVCFFIFYPGEYIVQTIGVVMALGIILSHRQNIKRIFNGTENKFNLGRGAK